MTWVSIFINNFCFYLFPSLFFFFSFSFFLFCSRPTTLSISGWNFPLLHFFTILAFPHHFSALNESYLRFLIWFEVIFIYFDWILSSVKEESENKNFLFSSSKGNTNRVVWYWLMKIVWRVKMGQVMLCHTALQPFFTCVHHWSLAHTWLMANSDPSATLYTSFALFLWHFSPFLRIFFQKNFLLHFSHHPFSSFSLFFLSLCVARLLLRITTTPQMNSARRAMDQLPKKLVGYHRGEILPTPVRPIVVEMGLWWWWVAWIGQKISQNKHNRSVLRGVTCTANVVTCASVVVVEVRSGRAVVSCEVSGACWYRRSRVWVATVDWYRSQEVFVINSPPTRWRCEDKQKYSPCLDGGSLVMNGTF